MTDDDARVAIGDKNAELLWKRIDDLNKVSRAMLAALKEVTDHFAGVMGGPFLAGVTFANGVEGIPTIKAARAAIAQAEAAGVEEET